METRNLGDLVKALAKDNTALIYSIPALVKVVDKNANTCDVSPLDDSGDFLDVALTQDSAKSLVCYPKVGSTVMLSFQDKNTAYVSQFGEIESYLMANGDDSLFKILDDMLQLLLDLKLQTNYGPTTTVLTALSIQKIKDRLPKFFTT